MSDQRGLFNAMRAAIIAMMLMIASQAGAGETIRSALMLSFCRDININEVQEIDTENDHRMPQLAPKLISKRGKTIKEIISEKRHEIVVKFKQIHSKLSEDFISATDTEKQKMLVWGERDDLFGLQVLNDDNFISWDTSYSYNWFLGPSFETTVCSYRNLLSIEDRKLHLQRDLNQLRFQAQKEQISLEDGLIGSSISFVATLALLEPCDQAKTTPLQLKKYCAHGRFVFDDVLIESQIGFAGYNSINDLKTDQVYEVENCIILDHPKSDRFDEFDEFFSSLSTETIGMMLTAAIMSYADGGLSLNALQTANIATSLQKDVAKNSQEHQELLLIKCEISLPNQIKVVLDKVLFGSPSNADQVSSSVQNLEDNTKEIDTAILDVISLFSSGAISEEQAQNILFRLLSTVHITQRVSLLKEYLAAQQLSPEMFEALILQ